MRVLLRSFLLLATAVAGATFSQAGTVSLRWNPSTGATGYKVFYGTGSGSYSSQVDVGNVTQTTVSGLTDCTLWYLAVKAYDATGALSSTYSNEVSGWPRPTVSAVSPSSVEQGRRLTLTVDGNNFASSATLAFATAGIVVHSVSVQTCSRLTADVTVGTAATSGASDVEVTNADRSFGTRAGGFQVAAAVAPSVTGTSPAEAATGVAVSVQPTITFTEAMLAASVTPSTVRLLDSTGAAVALAGGSPSLSADGKTVTLRPAASLALDATYRIEAVGGSAGVRDLAGLGMGATFRQATGFTTAADTTAPAISGVQALDVTSSSARIAWTTNEAADGQVFYRRSGDATYQQTSVDPTRVTSHSITISGLSASTPYQYHVRSADAAGNAATSNDQTFTTPASTYVYLRAELEDGVLTAPVRSVPGSGAFEGSWVDTPGGTAFGSASAPAGTAVLDVYVPKTATWHLWVRLNGPTPSADAWFESVDGATRQSISPTAWGGWQWVRARSYSLSTGLHRVELGGRETSALADRILLTDDAAFVPSEVPAADTTSPSAPTGFTAVQGNKQNLLQWVAPTSADHVKTVVRYRTDGAFPRTPVDGMPVVEQTGGPGTGGSYTHANLANNTTYRYAAFSVDATGNASLAATAQSTPSASGSAPGQVKNAKRK